MIESLNDLETLFEECKTKLNDIDKLVERQRTQISRLKRENKDMSEELFQIKQRQLI